MEQRVPPLEDRERAVCPACGYVDYVNPTNVVGTVPIWPAEQGPQVLLCRRNINPRRGFWTLPAGYLEYGESLAEGAVRETLEEAGARVELGGICTLFDVLRPGQVHVFFHARLLDLALQPGPETIENRLFGLGEVPWGELAFPTVERTLRLVAAGETTLHHEVIGPAGPLGAGG